MSLNRPENVQKDELTKRLLRTLPDRYDGISPFGMIQRNQLYFAEPTGRTREYTPPRYDEVYEEFVRDFEEAEHKTSVDTWESRLIEKRERDRRDYYAHLEPAVHAAERRVHDVEIDRRMRAPEPFTQCRPIEQADPFEGVWDAMYVHECTGCGYRLSELKRRALQGSKFFTGGCLRCNGDSWTEYKGFKSCTESGQIPADEQKRRGLGLFKPKYPSLHGRGLPVPSCICPDCERVRGARAGTFAKNEPTTGGYIPERECASRPIDCGATVKILTPKLYRTWSGGVYGPWTDSNGLPIDDRARCNNRRRVGACRFWSKDCDLRVPWYRVCQIGSALKRLGRLAISKIQRGVSK